jgi:Uracil phosphoribosyltransferase
MMAVELVTEHLKVKLRQHPLVRQYPNLECMESSSILRQLHTIIRDRNTSRADFVFYADRLIRLVVETGLGCGSGPALDVNSSCARAPQVFQWAHMSCLPLHVLGLACTPEVQAPAF